MFIFLLTNPFVFPLMVLIIVTPYRFVNAFFVFWGNYLFIIQLLLIKCCFFSLFKHDFFALLIYTNLFYFIFLLFYKIYCDIIPTKVIHIYILQKFV